MLKETGLCEALGCSASSTRTTPAAAVVVTHRTLFARRSSVPRGLPARTLLSERPEGLLADLERPRLSGRSLSGLDRKQFDVVDRRTKCRFKRARVSLCLREEIPALR